MKKGDLITWNNDLSFVEEDVLIRIKALFGEPPYEVISMTLSNIVILHNNLGKLEAINDFYFRLLTPLELTAERYKNEENG